MKKIFATVSLLLSLQLFAAGQAAFFDPSFGNGGFAETDFGYSEVGFWSEMLIQPDGKLLVRLNQAQHLLPQQKRLVKLARFLPDGTVDSTFGTGGTVVLLDTLSTARSLGTRQLALLPDGKILSAVSVYLQPNVKTTVFKFDSAGKPDPSFGNGGKVEITDVLEPWVDAGTGCLALFPLPDGKILLCLNDREVGFRVLNANGSLFNGSPVNWTWSDPEEEYLFQWRLGPDSKVVACGQVADRDLGSSSYDVFFGRYNAAGWEDGTFADFGTLRQDINSSYDAASDFQFQPDGKILYIGTTASKFLMGRLLPNGTPDTTFHGIGYRVFPEYFPGGVIWSDLAFSPLAVDQHCILTARTSSGGLSTGYLLRLKAEGVADLAFNGGEPVLFPTNGYIPQRSFILPDRRILVCGTRALNSTTNGFFIARLLPEADALAWYADADGDGFGSAASGIRFSVGQPAGFVPSNNDCDDASAQIFPGNTETCNGTDDNCDGRTDEIPAIACQPSPASHRWP